MDCKRCRNRSFLWTWSSKSIKLSSFLKWPRRILKCNSFPINRAIKWTKKFIKVSICCKLPFRISRKSILLSWCKPCYLHSGWISDFGWSLPRICKDILSNMHQYSYNYLWSFWIIQETTNAQRKIFQALMLKIYYYSKSYKKSLFTAIWA